MTVDIGRSPQAGRAAAADAVEPSFTVSSKADIPNAGTLDFNLTTEFLHIKGHTSSLKELNEFIATLQTVADHIPNIWPPERTGA